MQNRIYNNVEIFTLDTPGKRIKDLRLKKYMSICELAAVSKISIATISSIENERKNPSLTVLKKLSFTLDTPLHYLGCFDSLSENTLKEKIKKARLYHGLYRKEFGELLNVNEKTVAGWEEGKQRPTDENYEHMQKYLNIL